MSAAVIPFTGQWQGTSKPKRRADIPQSELNLNRAFRDARLIRAARCKNDDWTARMLLAILQSLSSKQRELVEFRLLGENLTDQSGVEALAIVQLVTGSNAHRNRVREMLDRLGGEAE